MAKISILLSVESEEKYLSQCIDSIIKQTFKDFECICLVDHQITQASVKILKEYLFKDNRIKIILAERNKINSEKNMFITNSNSHYITFVNSCDWISNKYIENLYFVCILNDYDISCACHKNYFEYDKKYESKTNITKIKKILSKKSKNINDKKEILNLSKNIWNKMYKTEFIKKNKIIFSENNINMCDSDYNFNLQCFSLTNKIVFIEDELYFKRIIK